MSIIQRRVHPHALAFGAPLIFISSCCRYYPLLEKHLSHEQAIRVLVVELDDVGQLVRLSREVERVGVLHLVTNSVK